MADDLDIEELLEAPYKKVSDTVLWVEATRSYSTAPLAAPGSTVHRKNTALTLLLL